MHVLSLSLINSACFIYLNPLFMSKVSALLLKGGVYGVLRQIVLFKLLH